MTQQLIPALRVTLFLTVLTGLLYPVFVTAIAQAIFRDQANGSLIIRNGHVIGSELIGQSFTRPEYFHPRPSAAGHGYDAAASGGSNLGPTSSKLIERTKNSVATYRAENPNANAPVPPDAVLTSASGLDPHISPENAQLQAPRIARTRQLETARILELIRQLQESRDLGLLGEPRINVLRLNLALDQRFPSTIAKESTR